MKNKLCLRLFLGGLLFFLVVVFNTCSFGDSEGYGNTPGIALGFDDFYPDTWEQHFDCYAKGLYPALQG